MPNNKSAERRMRNSARKQLNNHATQSRLKTLERKFAESIKIGKKDDAAKVLADVSSAIDKAAKVGVLHRSTASRKRSRLTLQFNRIK